MGMQTSGVCPICGLYRNSISWHEHIGTTRHDGKSIYNSTHSLSGGSGQGPGVISIDPWDNLKVGDMVTIKNSTVDWCEVLEITENLVAIDFDNQVTWYTKRWLKQDWTIKDSTVKETEETVDIG